MFCQFLHFAFQDRFGCTVSGAEDRLL